MRTPHAPTEPVPAMRQADPWEGYYRPPRPPAQARANLWRARREQAWTITGYLAAANLAVILIFLAMHLGPSLLGIR